MKSVFSALFRSLVLVFTLAFGVLAGYFVGNYEQIITQNMILPKLEKVIEENNIQFNQSFVVESEGDQLYINLRSTIEESYLFDGVSELDVNIIDSYLLSKGANQCSFVPDVEDFNLKCSKAEVGTFVNFIVELEVNYKENDVLKQRQERGLVVFVKSSEMFDIFTWKLVRFNRMIITN